MINYKIDNTISISSNRPMYWIEFWDVDLSFSFSVINIDNFLKVDYHEDIMHNSTTNKEIFSNRSNLGISNKSGFL